MTSWIVVVLVAFVSQMIDGSLGMGYKAISSSILLSVGIPPATVTATTHAAGFFTSTASGAAHWREHNVVKRHLLQLAVSGVAGGLLGCLVVTSFDAAVLKKFMASMLILVALRIILQFSRSSVKRTKWLKLPPLGVVGGFLDAVGGGGWGPVVTTGTIEITGAPRTSIGTSNAAEAFVSGAVAVALVGSDRVSDWSLVLWLALGGLLAAPFAAKITRRMSPRAAGLAVGVLLLLLNLRTLLM
jgi:hypothetical protein